MGTYGEMSPEQGAATTIYPAISWGGMGGEGRKVPTGLCSLGIREGGRGNGDWYL
jgi:hypothetical protein